MFIYLQNDLRSQQIFGNINFWEKYALLAVRNELRNVNLSYSTKKEKEALMKDVIFSKLCTVSETILSFGLPKEIVKNIISNFCDSMKLEQEKKNILSQKIDFYGLTAEEIQEIETEQNHMQSQTRSSGGWFGGFGTSTLSRVGAMFTGSTEKSPRRSSSVKREESYDSEEEEKGNRSHHISSSFVTPTKGESNSDYGIRESSGGSAEYSREYERKGPFEVVEVVEEEVEGDFEDDGSGVKRSRKSHRESEAEGEGEDGYAEQKQPQNTPQLEEEKKIDKDDEEDHDKHEELEVFNAKDEEPDTKGAEADTKDDEPAQNEETKEEIKQPSTGESVTDTKDESSKTSESSTPGKKKRLSNKERSERRKASKEDHA